MDSSTFFIDLPSDYVVPETILEMKSEEWKSWFNIISEIKTKVSICSDENTKGIISDFTKKIKDIEESKDLIVKQFEEKSKIERENSDAIIKQFLSNLEESKRSSNEEIITKDNYMKDEILREIKLIKENIDNINLVRKVPHMKGREGEICVQDYLIENFEFSKVSMISSQNHVGDLLLELEGLKIMLEVKNKSNVNQLDVGKFLNDLKNNRDYDGAVFISFLEKPINGIGRYSIKYLEDKPAIFITGFGEEPSVLKLAIMFLVGILKKCKKSSSLDNDLKDEITKDTEVVIRNYLSILNFMSVHMKTDMRIKRDIEKKISEYEVMHSSMLENIEHIIKKYDFKLKDDDHIDVVDQKPLTVLNHKSYFQELAEFRYKIEPEEKYYNKFLIGTFLERACKEGIVTEIGPDRLKNLVKKKEFEIYYSNFRKNKV